MSVNQKSFQKYITYFHNKDGHMDEKARNVALAKYQLMVDNGYWDVTKASTVGQGQEDPLTPKYYENKVSEMAAPTTGVYNVVQSRLTDKHVGAKIDDVTKSWLNYKGEYTNKMANDIFGYFVKTAKRRDGRRKDLAEAEGYNSAVSSGAISNDSITGGDMMSIRSTDPFAGPIRRREYEIRPEILKKGTAAMMADIDVADQERKAVYNNIGDTSAYDVFDPNKANWGLKTYDQRLAEFRQENPNVDTTGWESYAQTAKADVVGTTAPINTPAPPGNANWQTMVTNLAQMQTEGNKFFGNP